MFTKSEQTQKNKKPKSYRRKCKTCKEWFKTEKKYQVVCGKIDCALEHGKNMAIKQREQTKRAFNQKDKSKAREKAQIVFNAFIRERDKDLPCISCGRVNNVKYNAGHFKSAGQNPNLRFNELNVHKQCEYCNQFLSGNLAEYRKNLIIKIGLENVEALERDKSVKKYTLEDYNKIISEYKEKTKALQI